MFTSYSPDKQLGKSYQAPALGAPPGSAVPVGVAELLRDMTTQLGLSDAGVFTPWASRNGDMDWVEIEQPDTNIVLFGIDERQINQATELMFGQPIPFLTVRSISQASTAQLQRALDGSAYELYEVDAVYSQEDRDPVPMIWYLYWVRRLPLEQEGKKPMEAVAAELDGSVYFAQQVPVEGTTTRAAPSIPFDKAHGQAPVVQLPAPTPVVKKPNPARPKPGAPQPSVPQFPVEERGSVDAGFPAKNKTSFVGPVILGLGVAAATVAFFKAVKS